METKCKIPFPVEYLNAAYAIYTEEKEKRSRRLLEKYKNKKVVGTLSGKDSEVALRMSVEVFGSLQVYINRYVGRRKLPDSIVEELINIVKKLGGKPIVGEKPWGPHSSLFHVIAEEMDIDVIITGLRRQEDGDWHSKIWVRNREVQIVSPVSDWKHSDIWAYILYHKLPILTPYCGSVPWASLQSVVF